MSSIVTVGTRPVHGAYVAPAPTRMDLDSVLAPVAETLGSTRPSCGPGSGRGPGSTTSPPGRESIATR